MRREFSKMVRRDAFVRAEGKCESCGCRIKAGAVHYDHLIPDYFGGEPNLSNCQVLCPPCHRAKTSSRDVPAIAKTKRIRDREIGIRKAPTLRSAPFRKTAPQRSASRPIERRS